MTDSMIERVARAICKASGRCKYVGDRCNTSRCSVQPEEARAAIEAMREPAGEMTFSGMYAFAEAYENSNPRGVGQHEIAQVWQAMLDVALETPQKPAEGELQTGETEREQA